jgi:tRNA-splicing ligase RtcB
MDPARFTRIDETTWQIEPTGAMRVPGIIYADEALIRDMDDKVCEQTGNVATLPGIVKACYVMADAHWGYGFPIGGVAAFDADEGGVVSAGGVGFDVSCGVRTMLTGLKISDIEPVQTSLADSLSSQIPAGLGSKGAITLDPLELDAMLRGGARWAIERGWGEARDLDRIEEGGQVAGAEPDHVSHRAKERQRREMGTLGSGNHYLEVQAVTEVFDLEAAKDFRLNQEEVVVTIHCGSRGLGHQIGTEFLREMVTAAAEAGIALPDRELACSPIKSEVGQRYLGAMRAAINCALANREIIGHYARRVFGHFFPDVDLSLLFDVSHNTCKVEKHEADGGRRELFVHRHAGFRPRSSRSAGGFAQDGTARPYRRQHGDGLVCVGRCRDQREKGLCFCLPRCGSRDVASCSAPKVERPSNRRRSGGERNSDPMPFSARRRGGSPWRLQRCRRCRVGG